MALIGINRNHILSKYFSFNVSTFSTLAAIVLAKKMDIIVDVQFLKNNNDACIPKEVAVVAVNEDFSSHWIVLPPSSSVDKLNKNARNQNEWLTRNHHGLDYFDGEVSIKVLFKNLRRFLKSVRKVYVRGRDKLLYLQKITSREIINLETDNDCPSFDNLPWSSQYCFQHGINKPHLRYSCSLNNAHRLKLWLTRKDKKDSIEDEHSGSFEYYCPYSRTLSRRISSGSNSEGVDETDSICVQYR